MSRPGKDVGVRCV